MDQKPIRNADAPWDEMDPTKYLEANYGSILEPDREILCKHVEFYRNSPPHGAFLEIGGGPNLYPILAALPYVDSASIIEFGKMNVEYLKEQVESLGPLWDIWIEELRRVNPEAYAGYDFKTSLKEKSEVIQGSIFDLPKSQWNAGSMHFVSESLTQTLSEFDEANKKFAEAIKPGGVVVATFMKRSEGWSTSGPDLPAVPVIEENVQKSFEKYLDSFVVEAVQSAVPVREGDHGMIMLHGRRSAKLI